MGAALEGDRTTKVALVFNPATAPPLQFYLPSIEASASSLAIEANAMPVHIRDEFEGVIAAQASDAGGSVIVMLDGFNATHRDLIIALAAHYRVPTIYFNRYFAESGGLIAPTATIPLKRSTKLRDMWIAFLEAQNPPNCRSNCRANSNWRKHWASRYRPPSRGD